MCNYVQSHKLVWLKKAVTIHNLENEEKADQSFPLLLFIICGRTETTVRLSLLIGTPNNNTMNSMQLINACGQTLSVLQSNFIFFKSVLSFCCLDETSIDNSVWRNKNMFYIMINSSCSKNSIKQMEQCVGVFDWSIAQTEREIFHCRVDSAELATFDWLN